MRSNTNFKLFEAQFSNVLISIKILILEKNTNWEQALGMLQNHSKIPCSYKINVLILVNHYFSKQEQQRIGTTFIDWSKLVCLLQREQKITEIKPAELPHLIPGIYSPIAVSYTQ